MSSVHAAGAVVWRKKGGEFQVLLVRRDSYKDWSFPKGKYKPGEGPRMAAVREVYEETGEHIALQRPLPSIGYTLSSGKKKRVFYWVARPLTQRSRPVAARPEFPTAHPGEITRSRWMNAETALEKLSYKDERSMLKRVLKYWERGELATRAVLLVRHARAQKRSAWNGSEKTRPLTPHGASRARTIRSVFSVYGVDRLVSSPWQRCTATIAPYAQASGVSLTCVAALTEHSHAKNPAGVRKTIEAVLTDAGAPTAVSLHRPTLGTVIDVVKKHGGHHVKEKLPDDDPYLKTGEILVVHMKGDHAVDVERFRPVHTEP